MSGDGNKSENLKPIRVNSIKETSVKRILKPCEARAGHGVIGLFISLAIAGIALLLIIKLCVKLFNWIVN